MNQNTKSNKRGQKKFPVKTLLFVGGIVTGALLTSVVCLKPLQNSKLEKDKALETVRNRASVSVRLESECRSLKTECDMLQAKCAQLTDEMAQLKRKAR